MVGEILAKEADLGVRTVLDLGPLVIDDSE
jgi:hypothetical protein